MDIPVLTALPALPSGQTMQAATPPADQTAGDAFAAEVARLGLVGAAPTDGPHAGVPEETATVVEGTEEEGEGGGGDVASGGPPPALLPVLPMLTAQGAGQGVSPGAGQGTAPPLPDHAASPSARMAAEGTEAAATAPSPGASLSEAAAAAPPAPKDPAAQASVAAQPLPETGPTGLSDEGADAAPPNAPPPPAPAARTEAAAAPQRPAPPDPPPRPADTGPPTLVLAPEELGPLRVEFSGTGDTLRLVLSAERPETVELMRRHADLLLADLRQGGLGGASLDFGTWKNRQDRGARAAAAPLDSDAGERAAPPAPTHGRALLDLRW